MGNKKVKGVDGISLLKRMDALWRLVCSERERRIALEERHRTDARRLWKRVEELERMASKPLLVVHGLEEEDERTTPDLCPKDWLWCEHGARVHPEYPPRCYMFNRCLCPWAKKAEEQAARTIVALCELEYPGDTFECACGNKHVHTPANAHPAEFTCPLCLRRYRLLRTLTVLRLE